MILEIFSCSGGMAEGFRRAGLPVDMAFDHDPDAIASYERNLHHAPIRMDVRDLLRMVEVGWRPDASADHGLELLVADPPCTPWSRAGKRKGQEAERDMLSVTVELVRLLQPKAFLIANVPGLDDGPNWPTVQKTIGSLSSKGGWCIDFVRLDAANYGVPQHRIRPFWFGHRHGTAHVCWPEPTHCDPKALKNHFLAGTDLKPWVTCRQALGHLSPADLGSPVRLRWRGANGKQVASIPDSPARVVGTSNLSDGNVLAHPTEAVRVDHRRRREPGRKARASRVDEPADVVTCRQNGGGNVVFDGPDHRPSEFDAPARTLTRNTHGDGALLVAKEDMFSPSDLDKPSTTIRAAARGQQLMVSGKHRPNGADEPAQTLRGGGDGHSAPQVLLEVAHHPPSELDEPSRTIRAGTAGTPDKLLRTPVADLGACRAFLSCGRRATRVDTRFGRKLPVCDPCYDSDAGDGYYKIASSGGYADGATLTVNDRHPPNTLDAPSATVGAKADRGDQGATVLVTSKHPVSDADAPAMTLAASDGGGSKKVVEWPWDRPATVVHSDHGGRLAPPGHHEKSYLPDNRGHGPNAIKLSEKAAAILQGFPEGWHFAGDTKRSRWSQIGQAMPPPLAEAVARAIARQMGRLP